MVLLEPALRIGQQGRLRLRAYNSISYITSQNPYLYLQTNGTFRITNYQGNSIAEYHHNSGVSLWYEDTIKFQTTEDGFKVRNGNSETAVISGPQNIILDPSPDDVVAITTGAISAVGVSTITGITTTNIAVGNLIQEVDGVISAGTTVTSVGISSLTISNVSGSTTIIRNLHLQIRHLLVS